MYSGKESVEYPTGWAMNPMAYQHVPTEQVDWAALAQQWIQMKETCPPAAMAIPPQPPLPPNISTSTSDGEGGEAPMDVEGDVEAPLPPVISSHQWNATGWDGHSNQWNHNNQWGNWGWSQNSNEAGAKSQFLPTPEPPYQGYSTGENSMPGYTSTNNSNQQSYSGGYWTGDENSGEGKPRSSMRGARGGYSPSRHPRNRGGLHLHKPNHIPADNDNAPDTTQTIDAAKRKQLPAWIREGLEKMEREKQKQIDREREKKEREEYLRMKKLEEENASEMQPSDGVPRMPAKSKFDSESDKSDDEEKEIEREANKVDKGIRTQVHHIAPPPPLIKTKEDIIKELMLNVRRTLTEILLEVTDDQINTIAKEELARVRTKAQASRGVSVASKLQGLSAIGGGLGLGIYGDSSDSDSGSDDDSRGGTPDRKFKEKSGDDTDTQIQETIRRRKAEFEKTSREIESRIAEEERVELQRTKNDMGSRTPPPQRSPSSSESSTPLQEMRNGSDGESTSTNNRKEQIITTHRKTSRDASGMTDDTSRKHSTDTRDDHTSKSSRRESKQSREESSKSKSKNKNESSDSDSEDSDSGSDDSIPNRKALESDSESSSATNDSSEKISSKSDSDSSYKRSKKKKRRHSDDSVKKHKDKYKKSKSKHSDKERNNTEDTPSSKKKYYDREDSVTRDSRVSSRNSVQSPERKSHKSKSYYRSRSRSDDRRSRRYETSSSSRKYDSYKSRDRNRSKDRSSYSRDFRSRSRDRREYRSRSRDRRRSRDRKSESRDRRASRERAGRSSREGRRDRDRRGDTRSYYY